MENKNDNQNLIGPIFAFSSNLTVADMTDGKINAVCFEKKQMDFEINDLQGIITKQIEQNSRLVKYDQKLNKTIRGEVKNDLTIWEKDFEIKLEKMAVALDEEFTELDEYITESINIEIERRLVEVIEKLEKQYNEKLTNVVSDLQVHYNKLYKQMEAEITGLKKVISLKKTSDDDSSLDNSPVLMSVDRIEYVKTVFGIQIDRSEVGEVTVLDHLNQAPDNAVDVSADRDGSVKAWIEHIEDMELYHLYIAGNGKVFANENCKNLFYNYSKLQKADLSLLDTSRVKNMDQMFSNCIQLNNLNISDWDTSNVTSMQFMFRKCENLMQLDVEKWNMSNVKNTRGMFHNCAAHKGKN